MHEKLSFLYSSSESTEKLPQHEQSISHFPSKEQGQCFAHPFLQENDLGTPLTVKGHCRSVVVIGTTPSAWLYAHPKCNGL